MSLSKLEIIKCECGKTFEAEIWTSINAGTSPDLKNALVAGELNIVCCPECKAIFFAEQFLFYHDPKDQLLAFVYPLSCQPDREYWNTKMLEAMQKSGVNEDGRKIIDYEPILFFGMDSLARLLTEEIELADEEDVLSYSADEMNLRLIRLKPSLARARRIPKVLPTVDAKKDIRSGVLEGLKILMKNNDRLVHYAELLKAVENEKDWQVDSNCIVRKVKAIK